MVGKTGLFMAVTAHDPSQAYPMMAAHDEDDGRAVEAPPLPFGLREAEALVRKLAPALQEHGAWIQRIHALLVCRLPSSADDLAADSDRRSALGRWFEEENNVFLRRNPQYEAAVHYHKELYALARELCATISRNEPIPPEAYRAFVQSIEHLDRSLEALVRDLWDLLRYIDPLTGIATRFAMLPRLDEERDRVRRTQLPCSICMVDLDHFKRINDSYGHHAGDSVLQAVAAYFLKHLRRYDQVWRYGGEEFILLLPDTEPELASPIVDRLRHGLSELSIPIDPSGRAIGVTASFGIAPLDPQLSIHETIGNADQAMYEAKRSGRNQVRIWQGGTESLA
jgi:diguanylate cyclase (GGDEF)-like protein